MPWLQITLHIHPEQAAPLEDMLLLWGANAVSLLDGADQPVFEPEKGSTPLWQHTHLMGLFDASIDQEGLTQALRNDWQIQFPDTLFPRYRIEILEDKDWEREWMERFVPIQFTPNFWVCPSWKPCPDPDAVNLILDPGLAFGTGTHPTTQLCLQWIAEQSWSSQQVIDYGCGSGILALAAALLGATQITCVDNDEQALIATHDNAARNQIDLIRMPVFMPENTPQHPADTIVANILAGPLIDLAATLADLTKAGGKLCLSGILSEQSDAVEQAYAPWFTNFNTNQLDGWVRITATRKMPN